VIDLLPEQRGIGNLGGTMRLGLYPCHLEPGTRAGEAYGQPIVEERHRHRFEFNNNYREVLGARGLVFSGLSPDGRLVEIAEIADHPHGRSQFHPEFLSRPTFTSLFMASSRPWPNGRRARRRRPQPEPAART
jgi:CTP synthase